MSLVEWPERAGEAIPDATATVKIDIRPDGARLITAPDALLAPDPDGAAAEGP